MIWERIVENRISEFDESGEPVYERDANNNLVEEVKHCCRFILTPRWQFIVEITEVPGIQGYSQDKLWIRVGDERDWNFLGTLEQAKEKAIKTLDTQVAACLKVLQQYAKT